MYVRTCKLFKTRFCDFIFKAEDKLREEIKQEEQDIADLEKRYLST